VKEELVQMQGVVIHRVKNALVVALDAGPQIRATLAGRMQQNRVRIVCGARLRRDEP